MKKRENRTLDKRASGEVAMGINVQMSSPENVEIVGATGYDFVLLDCEHGSFYLDRVVEMCRAADGIGVTPLVRVPDHNPSFIMRTLDAGAMGVVVPNITSRAQAEAAVSAAKYKAPGNQGTRGACPSTRATWHLTSEWEKFAQWSNEQTTVWLLIESVEGINNIDEILDVPGIDAIVPGPFDLAHDMGYPGMLQHPEVVTALRGMVRKAKQKNVQTVAVLLASNSNDLKEEVEFWREVGATIFWVGGDRRLFTIAAQQRMTQVRNTLSQANS
jgi:4-hydroxy-2-oxoheptanedioate aldolase